MESPQEFEILNGCSRVVYQVSRPCRRLSRKKRPEIQKWSFHRAGIGLDGKLDGFVKFGPYQAEAWGFAVVADRTEGWPSARVSRALYRATGEREPGSV